MATYYFRSTATTWSNTPIATAAASWSSTPFSSGYTSVTTVPTATDDVVFEAASGPCTITQNVSCLNITFVNYVNTLTLSANLSAYGNIVLGTGMTILGTGSLNIIGTTAATLTSNGKQWETPCTISKTVATVTLNDNWTFSKLLTLGGSVINGNQIFLKKGLGMSGTSNFQVSGTTIINFIESGIWSHNVAGQNLKNTVNINLASGQTLTLGTFVTIGGILRWIAGTVDATQTELTAQIGSDIDCGVSVIFKKVNIATNQVKLSNDLYVSNELSSTSATGGIIKNPTTASWQVWNSGSLTALGTLLTSTATINMIGTGTINTASTGQLDMSLVINANTGTITMSNLTIKGSLKYTSGTVNVQAGSTLTLYGVTSIDTGASTGQMPTGITWENINFTGLSATYTVTNSLLRAKNISVSMPTTSPQTFATAGGNWGFYTDNLTMIGTTSGTSTIMGLSTSTTYTVTTDLTLTNIALTSNSPTPPATLPARSKFNQLNPYSLQSVTASAVDIDSSGGTTIWTTGTPLTRTTNWNPGTRPSNTNFLIMFP